MEFPFFLLGVAAIGSVAVFIYYRYSLDGQLRRAKANLARYEQNKKQQNVIDPFKAGQPLSWHTLFHEIEDHNERHHYLEAQFKRTKVLTPTDFAIKLRSDPRLRPYKASPVLPTVISVADKYYKIDTDFLREPFPKMPPQNSDRWSAYNEKIHHIAHKTGIGSDALVDSYIYAFVHMLVRVHHYYPVPDSPASQGLTFLTKQTVAEPDYMLRQELWNTYIALDAPSYLHPNNRSDSDNELLTLIPKTSSAYLTIPEAKRFEHHWIIATSGHGKTQCLQAMIAEDLKAVADNRASIVVIDSENKLIPLIAHLKQFAPGQPLSDKLIYIDPTDADYPLSFNLFDIGQRKLLDRNAKYQQSQEMLELFRFILGGLLEKEMTAKQRDIFEYCALLLLEVPEATIEDFLKLLAPKGLEHFRHHLANVDPITRQFFETQFDAKGQSGYEGTKTEVAQRLFSMLRNPTFRDMFLNKTTKLKLAHELQSSKVILVNTSEPFLKKDGTKLMGRFILALIANAAGQRELPTFVYIDEAYFYIKDDPNALDILARGRKRNLGLVVAHQGLWQLGQEGVASALKGLTAIKFAAKLNDSDCHTLASEMHCDPEFIRSQQAMSFAAHVRGMDSAVSITVPKLVIESMPTMTDEEFKFIRNTMRTRYSSAAPEEAGSQAETPHSPRKPESADDTLFWNITISPKKALKGGTHSLQILAEPSGQKKSVNVTIPAGTQDGARFRLRGAGVFRRNGTRGDIVLTIRVPGMTKNSQVTLYGDVDDPDGPDEIG
jgi:hypothetical protein